MTGDQPCRLFCGFPRVEVSLSELLPPHPVSQATVEAAETAFLTTIHAVRNTRGKYQAVQECLRPRRTAGKADDDLQHGLQWARSSSEWTLKQSCSDMQATENCIDSSNGGKADTGC